MAKGDRTFKFAGTKIPYNFEILNSGVEGEVGYATQLEQNALVVAWTKMHRIVIQYKSADGQIRNYNPDFLVRRTRPDLLELVETKGAIFRNDRDVQLKKKAAEDWCKRRKMEYRLLDV